MANWDSPEEYKGGLRRINQEIWEWKKKHYNHVIIFEDVKKLHKMQLLHNQK